MSELRGGGCVHRGREGGHPDDGVRGESQEAGQRPRHAASQQSATGSSDEEHGGVRALAGTPIAFAGDEDRGRVRPREMLRRCVESIEHRALLLLCLSITDRSC